MDLIRNRLLHFISFQIFAFHASSPWVWRNSRSGPDYQYIALSSALVLLSFKTVLPQWPNSVRPHSTTSNELRGVAPSFPRMFFPLSCLVVVQKKSQVAEYLNRGFLRPGQKNQQMGWLNNLRKKQILWRDNANTQAGCGQGIGVQLLNNSKP